jgi:transcription termination factor Rho
MLLKEVANAIATNHPECYLMVVLIDERPEEVTDMERSVNAEVLASTFDEPADKHVKVSTIALQKAKLKSLMFDTSQSFNGWLKEVHP